MVTRKQINYELDEWLDTVITNEERELKNNPNKPITSASEIKLIEIDEILENIENAKAARTKNSFGDLSNEDVSAEA